LEQVLQAMRQKGLRRAFAAYRADWPPVNNFFAAHGFRLAREMVNFLLDLADLPTPPARPNSNITPLRREDVPALFDLAPQTLRVTTPAALEQHLFANPYFGPEAVYVLRGRTGDTPVAVAVLVTSSTYAEPRALDAAMPCFRLGAFGTETMTTKRINGLFSFLARNDPNVSVVGLDLLSHVSYRLQDTDDVSFLAAQVPSDVPHLLSFYKRTFRQQASFPVYERELL
jgi:hypothetical protein